MLRRPCHWPLSRGCGASPARAAAWRRLSVPSSGSSASTPKAVMVPTPVLGELERWCREAVAANPKSAADFKAGKESAINAFKGPVMRAAKGRADPKRVDETLRRLLAQ